MTIDKNFKALFFGVHRYFRFSDSSELGVQRPVIGVHGQASEKNFRVHRTHFPDWYVQNIVHDAYDAHSFIKFLEGSFQSSAIKATMV